MKKIFILIILLITFCPNFSFGKTTEKIPEINARYAIVIDRSSKQILYGKNETDKAKMASTTKIMTAIVVIENTSLDEIATISSKAAKTGGSRLGLKTDDEISINDLLYGLMLRSGNDAAIALAEYVGGNVESFVELMNQKAKELELISTHFVTPHGLDDDEHYTTAYDLAILTDYALQNNTFSKIVATKTYTITINNSSKKISNTNELLGNFDGIYGVKTGFTNGANRCLVTACKRDDLDVICVVLGCDTKKDRKQDTIDLLNYIFNSFSAINIETIIDTNFESWRLLHTNSFTINKGTSQILKLYLDHSQLPYSLAIVNNSELENISTPIYFNTQYEAPLYANSIIGTLSFSVNDDKYFSIDIKNSNTIYRKTIMDYFLYLITF